MHADEIRKKLLDRADVLTSRVKRIESDLTAPRQQDSDDRAIEMENDEVLQRLEETDRRELESIRAAIARLDAGTWGTCSSCGEPIGAGRLEALPYTTVCVDCAR